MTKYNKIKLRPLGALSDFVVEKMAQTLRQSNAQTVIGKTATILVDNLSDQQIKQVINNPLLRDIASLDLKMLEIAVAKSNNKVTEQLINLVNLFAVATDTLPGLSYEEIILINPKNDLRLFTDNEVGTAERNFYCIHANIEQYFEQILVILRHIQTELLKPNTLFKDACLFINDLNISVILKSIVTLGMNMDPVLFKEFRYYLEPLSHRTVNGPSGAYSGAIPEIEIMLYGHRLSPQRLAYINNNQAYFPRANRLQIQIAQERPALADLVNVTNDNHTKIREIMIALSKFLMDFSRRHLGAVARQIPDAITNTTAGTGGEPAVGNFLKNVINERINHYKMFTDIFGEQHQG